MVLTILMRGAHRLSSSSLSRCTNRITLFSPPHPARRLTGVSSKSSQHSNSNYHCHSQRLVHRINNNNNNNRSTNGNGGSSGGYYACWRRWMSNSTNKSGGGSKTKGPSPPASASATKSKQAQQQSTTTTPPPKSTATTTTATAANNTSFLSRFLAPKEMPPRNTPKWYAEMALLCTVFGITGSSTMFAVRPAVSEVLGLKGSMKDGPWSYRICSLVIMTPVYATLLVIVGTAFGRHAYFRHFSVKMFSRFGVPPELMDANFKANARNFRKW